MKKLLRHIPFLLLLPVLFTGPLSAQSPYCKAYPISEVYVGAKPIFVEQSADGYLWVGTENGLFRFDGDQYEPFFLEGVPRDSQVVTAFYNDPSDRLWVGFESGAIYYLDDMRRWRRWMPEEGTPAAPVVGFTHGEDGTFWIATYGEGVYYRKNGRLYNYDIGDGLPAEDIYFLKKDGDGGIWVGTDGGLSRLWVEGYDKKIENITRAEGLPDDILKTLVIDSSGNFWLGFYDGGFCYFDPETREFQFPKVDWEGGVVQSMVLLEGRELWVGTETRGVWRFDLQSEQLEPVYCEHELQSAKILDLKKDREGNLWIVSTTHGVISINRHFEFMTAPARNLQAILIDRDHRLWLGAQNGLYTGLPGAVNGQDFEMHLGELSLNVISLCEGPQGNIWIGTFGDGVYIYAPREKRLRRLTESEGLTNGSVLSIARREDRLWLATLGGVTEVQVRGDVFSPEGLQLRAFQQESGLGSNFVYCAYVDSRGRPWFGTDGRGISYLEDGRIYSSPRVVMENRDTFELQAIYSITEDQRGHIWFSTAREGIFEFDGEQFKHYGLEEGLTDLSITSLLTDVNGQLLIVHPRGVDRLNPANGQIRYFGEESGLRGIDPNLNVAAHDDYGNIWLGSQDHLIRYTPLEGATLNAPRTLLNEVSVFLEPVNFHELSTFAHHQNNLIFNYAGLWYSHPESVAYRYQLEGFDLDWIHSRDRQATYSNLPPGAYTFKVASSVDGYFENEEVVSYSFRIRSPLWEQPWFVVLSIILLSALLYWAVRSRENRLQRETLLKKEKVESQFEALKSQINPHFLFNSFNTLITIIEEDTPLAVEYVEKLSDFYRSILQYREKELISLKEEIELIRNYRFLLTKRFGDNLRLHLDLNGEEGYVAPLTLQILVENAIKHNVISRSRPLRIDIYRDEQNFLVVRNNLQEKLTPVRSTQFGLQSISRRYELLSNRKIRVEKTDEAFIIRIPVIKNGDS